ncbi:hypothetical protein GCM10022255_111270 [Dactylosporangium darangshiense]|uniref:Uncharacterized protein n=1 Tax=Dactylosporangium darangshiense TaxID=579108 RepID=A0ABP8DV07_9ACTN
MDTEVGAAIPGVPAVPQLPLTCMLVGDTLITAVPERSNDEGGWSRGGSTTPSVPARLIRERSV